MEATTLIYPCLYTVQKTQKRKKWKDGEVRIQKASRSVTVFPKNEKSGRVELDSVDSKYLELVELNALLSQSEDSFETEKLLVTIEFISADQDYHPPPPPPPPRVIAPPATLIPTKLSGKQVNGVLLKKFKKPEKVVTRPREPLTDQHQQLNQLPSHLNMYSRHDAAKSSSRTDKPSSREEAEEVPQIASWFSDCPTEKSKETIVKDQDDTSASQFESAWDKQHNDSTDANYINGTIDTQGDRFFHDNSYEGSQEHGHPHNHIKRIRTNTLNSIPGENIDGTDYRANEDQFTNNYNQEDPHSNRNGWFETYVGEANETILSSQSNEKKNSDLDQQYSWNNDQDREYGTEMLVQLPQHKVDSFGGQHNNSRSMHQEEEEEEANSIQQTSINWLCSCGVWASIEDTSCIICGLERSEPKSVSSSLGGEAGVISFPSQKRSHESAQEEISVDKILHHKHLAFQQAFSSSNGSVLSSKEQTLQNALMGNAYDNSAAVTVAPNMNSATNTPSSSSWLKLNDEDDDLLDDLLDDANEVSVPMMKSTSITKYSTEADNSHHDSNSTLVVSNGVVAGGTNNFIEDRSHVSFMKDDMVEQELELPQRFTGPSFQLTEASGESSSEESETET